MLDDRFTPHLDHVFLTVDPKTMDDILACELLRDDAFSRFRVKQATSTLLGPYETANILGESTFVEFFPAKKPPFPGVTIGIVLSFDRPGEAASAGMELVRDGGVGFDFELNRREVKGYDDPQEWYRLLRPKLGDNSPITLFLSEITESYFDILGAPRDAQGQQPRSAYLDAAAGEPHRADQLFRNISHVTLRLKEERAATLARALRTLGYQQAHGDLVLTGPEATITILTDDTQPEGLTKLELDLLRPFSTPGHVLRFGSGSVLTFSINGADDPTAIWEFVPSEPHIREI